MNRFYNKSHFPCAFPSFSPGGIGPTGPTGATGSFVGGVTFDPGNLGGYLEGQVIFYNGSTYVVNKNNPTGIPGQSSDYTLVSAAGATGPTGATGSFVGGVTFDPGNLGGYLEGQVIFYNGSTYVVNKNNPTGIPGQSSDYTLVSAAGATGPTGATGSFVGGVTFDPGNLGGYLEGQVIFYNGSTYVVNKNNPTGIPGQSSDYTLVSAAGATGPTGATGSFVGGVTFDPGNLGGYLEGQVIFYNGSTYVVNKNNPTGIPGQSSDYTLVSAAGATGPTGATGSFVGGVTFDPGNLGGYLEGQVIFYNGSTYVVNKNNPTGIPGQSSDYTLVSAAGATGPTGPQGAQGIQGPIGPQGAQGIQGPTGLQGTQGIQGPTGLQGAQGIQGPTGLQGAQGIQGPTGLQGAQGIQGPTGLQGAQGIQGPTGPTGAGTIVTNNNGMFTGTIVPAGTYSLTTNTLNGNGIVIVGGDTVSLQIPATYYITYSVLGFSEPTRGVKVNILRNNVNMGDSYGLTIPAGSSGTDYQSSSNSVIINVSTTTNIRFTATTGGVANRTQDLNLTVKVIRLN
ncbi:collagen-like protein [Bacillus sp. FSL K6-0067]|uniref:collagen-like protein n=1 Tax=Bacillus sp. FSL K6-0067 TaxID=2921412 RepID=UPI0030FA991D